MATTETILEATVKAGVEYFGGFPSGTMIAFAGKSVPDGWLLCNGALVSRTTYAKLFAAIGTVWGAGDGSTTFKLPDADGRVMQGVTDASNVGKYLQPTLPNITGNVGWDANALFNYATGAFRGIAKTGSYVVAGGASGDVPYKYADFSASRSSSLYSGTKLQPPAFQTLIIIKI